MNIEQFAWLIERLNRKYERRGFALPDFMMYYFNERLIGLIERLLVGIERIDSRIERLGMNIERLATLIERLNRMYERRGFALPNFMM
ncbi:hypothetical protein [Sporosarcina sp. P21c]|uniref:hypothetical protein n=1 Tax=Sporosarcina sp. P21c TaxID=2048255 RepID=UPI000C171A55|nr:hypothetical protein [Sporosarcina sp. P21c]